MLCPGALFPSPTTSPPFRESSISLSVMAWYLSSSLLARPASLSASLLAGKGLLRTCREQRIEKKLVLEVANGFSRARQIRTCALKANVCKTKVKLQFLLKVVDEMAL